LNGQANSRRPSSTRTCTRRARCVCRFWTRRSRGSRPSR
jgi:hypothetical protein